MKRALDSYDRRILDELRGKGRISHSDLAVSVHLSRNAVRQRVNRLERDGIIRGYTVLIDEQSSSSSYTNSAVMFVYRIDRMPGGEVVRNIKTIPEVTLCDILSGEFDLLVRIETSDPGRLREIWKIIARMPGVKDTVTSMVLG